MKDKAEKPKRIFDVDVNRAAIKPANSLDEFKKVNPSIFDHLGDQETKAYEELWAEGKTPPTVKPTGPTPEGVKP